MGIIYPFIIRPLHKETVDLFYYSIAIVGIAILFSTQSSERESLKITARLTDLQNKQEHIKELNEDINSKLGETGYPYFENELKHLLAIAISANKNSHVCISSPKDKCALGLKYELIANSILQGRNFKLEVSKHTQEEVFRALHSQDVLLSVDPELDVEISIPGENILSLFYSETEDSGKSGIRSSLDRRLLRYEREIERNNVLLNENKPKVSDLFNKALFTYVWAYILCMALSLKLARHTFFERKSDGQ